MRPLRFLSLSGAKLEVREEVRQLVEPLAEESGYEVVDVEHAFQGHRRVIRVLLDKPGGVTIDDCARFSRRLSDCLDMNQTITGSYQLEVSSAGIERPLKTLVAVERFAGRRATLALFEPHDGRRNFEGMLLDPVEGRMGMRTDDGAEFWFPWVEVKSVRLVATDLWGRERANHPGPRGGA